MINLKPAFHEIIFPSRLTFGSFAGLERKTDIIQMASGYEQRNTSWQQARRRYKLNAGPRPLAELYDLMAFFEARQGPLIGFRWRDWLDCKSCAPHKTTAPTDQICAPIDDENHIFALQKTYGAVPDQTKRLITKPRDKSVKVAVDNVALAQGDYSIDTMTGHITLVQAVTENQVVTAGFEFDVPVRFDTDRLEVELVDVKVARVSALPMIELRLDNTAQK